MESKLNYTLVGLFVVILLAGLVMAVLWLSGQNSNQQYQFYRVYMAESVSGLSADSSVKYLGVDVGTVSHIGLNADNSQQVELLLQIDQNVPIKTDTVATLKFFGITGLAFIELTGTNNDSSLLPIDSDSIPIIASSPSTIVRVDEALSTIASKTTTVLDRLDQLMNDDNLQNLSILLDESIVLVKDLRNVQQQFAEFLEQGIDASASLEQALNKVGTASESVNNMADDLAKNGEVMEQKLTATMQQITVASQSVDSLATSIKQEYAGIGVKVGDDVEQSLRAFRQLLNQLDMLVGDMQRTIKTIEDSPSDLLFKSSQPKLGPGEGK
jgi:phospholipid/cholesterol/gamma-HCH transport system substrate-binding protein